MTLTELLEQLKDTPLDEIPTDTAKAVAEHLLKQEGEPVEVARFNSSI